MLSWVVGPDGRWYPGIGDPTFVGWLTVFCYFGACYAAVRAAKNHAARMSVLKGRVPEAAHDQRTLGLFWFFAAVLMGLLGVNKQLDLQSWFTEVGRDLAFSQGWYADRHVYQGAFILVIVMVTLFMAAAALVLLWRVLGEVMLGVVGVGFTLAFVVIRAASFHHVDLFLGSGDIRLNWVIELFGIALFVAAAVRAVRRNPPPGTRARPAARR